MAGSSLEEEEKYNHSGSSPKMDRLMLEVEQLSKLSDVPDVPKYMLDMMAQLVDLRKTSWGINQPSPSVNQGPMSNLRNPYVMGEAAQVPQEVKYIVYTMKVINVFDTVSLFFKTKILNVTND